MSKRTSFGATEGRVNYILQLTTNIAPSFQRKGNGKKSKLSSTSHGIHVAHTLPENNLLFEENAGA